MRFGDKARNVAASAVCAIAIVFFGCGSSTAQLSGWLRYAIPPDPPRYHDLPHAVVVLGNAPEELTAADELDHGVGHMLGGTDVLLHRFDPHVDAIVLGTTEALRSAGFYREHSWHDVVLPEEGFRIVHVRHGARQWYVLQGGSPRAELWAACRFNALIAEDQQLPEELLETPQLGVRGLEIREDGRDSLSWSADFANNLFRSIASAGLNTIVLDVRGKQIDRVAAEARRFGIRVWYHVSSEDANALESARRLGNSAGVVVEPLGSDLAHLRSAVLSVNVLVKTLQGRGCAVVIENALGEPFLNSLDLKNTSSEERALLLQRYGLDADVILSEPATSTLLPLTGLASPNFGLLPQRDQIARFDLVTAPPGMLAYPAQVWQRVLQTPERQVKHDGLLMDSLQARSNRGGMIATVSVRSLEQMFDQPLLQANLYAFGRIAWNPKINVEVLTEEWSRLTWGDDARAYAVAQDLLLKSVKWFVDDTSPLGLASLANSDRELRPSQEWNLQRTANPIESKDFWGSDRSTSGTNEIREYPEKFTAQLDSLRQCPEEWLLAFHRVRYTYTLRDGRTAVQTFYDLHFAAAAQMANALDHWETVEGLVDEERYRRVHTLLVQAALRAEIWREITTEWLQRSSGITDALGFVGSYPGRLEAEEMKHSGWQVRKTDEPEDASGGAYLQCDQSVCSAGTVFKQEDNVYRIEAGYFSASSDVTFDIKVNGIQRASWSEKADQNARRELDARRFVANGVLLRSGDFIEITVKSARLLDATLDFIQITRDPRWN